MLCIDIHLTIYISFIRPLGLVGHVNLRTYFCFNVMYICYGSSCVFCCCGDKYRKIRLLKDLTDHIEVQLMMEEITAIAAVSPVKVETIIIKQLQSISEMMMLMSADIIAAAVILRESIFLCSFYCGICNVVVPVEEKKPEKLATLKIRKQDFKIKNDFFSFSSKNG